MRTGTIPQANQTQSQVIDPVEPRIQLVQPFLIVALG